MAGRRKANIRAILDEDLHKLHAMTDEELHALKVNLRQQDERPNARDGSGHVVDELAEERVSKLTEAGPLQEDSGAVSVMAGRDNTSETLRRHYCNLVLARAKDVVEGNLDELSEDTSADRTSG